LVLRNELSSEDSHWLGYMHLDKLMEEGVTVEPFHGACLSRAAIRKAEHLWPGAWKDRMALWPPTRHSCRVLNEEDVPWCTNILNSCMRVATNDDSGHSVGIFPSDPEFTFDDHGRLLYLSWTPFNCDIVKDKRLFPPLTPYSRIERRINISTQHMISMNYWRGREYIYGRCLGHNARWVSEYPVIFHGHVTHEAGFLRRLQGGRSEWKASTHSHKEVHALLARYKWRLPDDFECHRPALASS